MTNKTKYQPKVGDTVSITYTGEVTDGHYKGGFILAIPSSPSSRWHWPKEQLDSLNIQVSPVLSKEEQLKVLDEYLTNDIIMEPENGLLIRSRAGGAMAVLRPDEISKCLAALIKYHIENDISLEDILKESGK